MNNYSENIINEFNSLILKIEWFKNLGKLDQKKNIQFISNYLNSINTKAKIQSIPNWREALIIINNKEYDKDLWKKEELENKSLYMDILKKIPKKKLEEYLSTTTLTSNKIVNNTLRIIAKKNNITDQYFFKVAGGAAGLICYQRVLALLSGANKDHMFNTKFKIFTIGNWPLTVQNGIINVF